jgi:plasmid stabilization system protein ParE
LRRGLRRVRVRSHYLILGVNAAMPAVTIARVLHTLTDLDRNLP